MCDQQRLRPSCANAQSDQSLCKSLEYSMSVKLLIEQHLGFKSLKGGCTGSSESTLVKIPHYWKSHATAYIELIWDCQGFLYRNGLKMRLMKTDPGMPQEIATCT